MLRLRSQILRHDVHPLLIDSFALACTSSSAVLVPLLSLVAFMRMSKQSLQGSLTLVVFEMIVVDTMGAVISYTGTLIVCHATTSVSPGIATLVPSSREDPSTTSAPSSTPAQTAKATRTLSSAWVSPDLNSATHMFVSSGDTHDHESESTYEGKD